MLDITGIDTFYGLSQALFGLSLNVERKEIICLLGRNGAGKTTALKSVIGLVPPRSGEIKFKGEDIIGKPPYKIASLGIGYVPPDKRVFPTLTVRENLEVAIKDYKSKRAWSIDSIYGFFPQLKHLDKRKAGYLSGGERQMLVTARTLMGNPELILLDEPTEGLSPIMVSLLMQQIKKLREEGLTVILAEMNVRSALGLSDRAYILEKGQIRYEGRVGEIMNQSQLLEKYLAL